MFGIPCIINASIAIPHYDLLRNDASSTVQKHGVCVYVHRDINVDNVTCPMTNVLVFRLTKYNVFVIVVYRPPSYTQVQNQELLGLLDNVVRDREAIVIGDFKGRMPPFLHKVVLRRANQPHNSHEDRFSMLWPSRTQSPPKSQITMVKVSGKHA